MKPALIGVDWGTSSFRAVLVGSDGGALARHESADGILSSAGRFAEVLAGAVGGWPGAGTVPVLMSGMIGSRQGWREADYVACPARAGDLVLRLAEVAAPMLGTVRIVPGLSTRDGAGRPDVIRGEETQVIGALALSGASDGLFVLPGTHSKWVSVEGGAIADFATYMTGEVYGALKSHTILGRLMAPAPSTGEGFRRGVAAGAETGGPGTLLNRLFAARTLGLFGELAAGDIADYLSGLLIGAELRAATAGRQAAFTVIAAPALEQRYREAAGVLGLDCRPAPADCALAGQRVIARAAGLFA
jgi:2-dehydro-3-deoxygalactonokinase